MIPLAVLVVGAWAQWKAYRWCLAYLNRPVTSPEVGRSFQEMAHRDPEALAQWFADITPSEWDATGELPVIRPGDGAIDTQLRLGET